MIAVLLAAVLQDDCAAFFYSVRVRYLHTSQPFGQTAILKVEQIETPMYPTFAEALEKRREILKEGIALPYIGQDEDPGHTEFRVAPGSMLSASGIKYCCRPLPPFPWYCNETP